MAGTSTPAVRRLMREPALTAPPMYEREADLAAAVVHPDRLRWWITGLVLGHIVASLVAVSSWPNRWYVWVLTALQLLFTLLCGMMSQMAMQGDWL